MKVERRGQHHSLPQQYQEVEQGPGGGGEEAPGVGDLGELLQDDEAVPGEEEAVARDVQPSPGVARPPAGLLAEEAAHPAHTGHLLHRGEHQLGEEVPDGSAEEEAGPGDARLGSQQVSLERRNRERGHDQPW